MRTAGRHFLQIPGPSPVPDRILRAIDIPVIDHRGPGFAELGNRVLAGMQGIFQTSQPVINDPAALRADSDHSIKALCVVHNETSTGCTSRIAPVRKAMDNANHPALLLVDTNLGHLGDINDVTLLGTLAGIEMGLYLADVPHQSGGVQAALDYLKSSTQEHSRAA